ncbi:MAG: hypothetical protein U0Q20_01755 [Mycobacterium sp.]
MRKPGKTPKAAARRDQFPPGRRGGGQVLDDRPRRADGRTAENPAHDRRPKNARISGPARDQRGMRPAGPATAPMPRVAPAKSSSQAKARAKARKAKAPKVVRVPLRERLRTRLVRLAEIDLSPRTLLARVPFVVLVIGALGLGLGVTLWLSTDAAERSYQLGRARVVNQALQQQKEALERQVLEAQAAPALAEAARNLGMIPSRDTAHLVQDPGGNWIVVGNPKPAEGVPPPPLNVKLPDEAPPAPPARTAERPMRVGPAPSAPAPNAVAPAPNPVAPGQAIAPAPAPGGSPEVPVPLDHSPGGPAATPLGAPAVGPAPGPADTAPGLVIVPVPAAPAPAPVPAPVPAAPAPVPAGAPA